LLRQLSEAEQLYPEEDPVFNAPGSPAMGAAVPPVFHATPGPFSGGSASPFSSEYGLSGGALQSDLLNDLHDPWMAQEHHPAVSQGAIGSRSWQCDKCSTKNNLGATRCVNCHWDRKAALKLRMRQDLMAKMASNGGIPGEFPNGVAKGAPHFVGMDSTSS